MGPYHTDVFFNVVAELPRELHAGRAAAHDDEREQVLLLLESQSRIAGGLEARMDADTNCPPVPYLLHEHGILADAFNPKCVWERPNGNDKLVVLHFDRMRLRSNG